MGRAIAFHRRSLSAIINRQSKIVNRQLTRNPGQPLSLARRGILEISSASRIYYIVGIAFHKPQARGEGCKFKHLRKFFHWNETCFSEVVAIHQQGATKSVGRRSCTPAFGGLAMSDGHVVDFKLDNLNRSKAAHDWEIDRPEIEEEVPAYYKRRSAGVWACLATLTVALAAVVVYGYAVLSQEGLQVEQVPGLAKSLPAIAQHLGNVEQRLADARADQQKLASQVRNFDALSQAALGQTREQTGQMVAGMKASLLKGLSQQTSVLQAQLTQLVSARSADQVHLAQVEEQLSDARNELEAARTDFASQVAALREQQGVEHRELTSLSDSLPTRQATFEAQKNHEFEVAPGVSFQLTKTDVRHQRFDGTIASAPDHQKVSVQSQGIRTPVVFFPAERGKAYMMVVTSVNQKGVSGYVLIPAKDGTTDPKNFISATGEPSTSAIVPMSHASSLTAQ
jgi:hypothetical protein